MSDVPPAPAFSDGADEGLSRGGERWLLVTVAVGITLAPLNSTMIAVALPDIQQAFGVSVTATAWLVTIYLVAMAVGQPIGGRLGDLYGRRRVYLLGLALFAIASAGCAFAASLPVLIMFRTMQALAGALSFPNGAAMIREAIPSARRGSAFGTVGMVAMAAAASGPPLGGLLVHWFGWSSIFWANVPVVTVAVALGLRSLPRQKLARLAETARERFDLVGTGLFAGALAGLIVIPTLLRQHRMAVAVAVALISVAIAIGFIRWELRSSAPVVNLRLFRHSGFAAACLSICLSNLVMYTTLLALPLYLERVRGHDSRVTGLTLAALSALAALAGPLGGRWSDARGYWLPAVVGAAGLAVGTAALAGAVGSTVLLPILLALAAMGLGLGISGAPVQAAAVEAAPGRAAGAASGIYSTARYIGSVIGSTVLAVVFATRPASGASGRFEALFAALAVVAVAGIVVNTRVAARVNVKSTELASV